MIEAAASEEAVMDDLHHGGWCDTTGSKTSHRNHYS